MPEFIKRYWTQIRLQTTEMPANTKLLIGSLIVILLLVVFVVLQYVGEPEWVPITSFAGERRAEVTVRLEQAGIEVKDDGEQLLVPFEQRAKALAVMESGGMLGADTSAAFDEMIRNSSPWDSSTKSKMALLEAKRKFLGQVIAKMKGVRAADVVLSVPDDKRFGRSYVKPTASVSVVMEGGEKMNNALVKAVAGVVSGSVAEMTPREVTVIDANNGREHKVADDDEASSEEMMLAMTRVENHYRDRIAGLLRYIPGVIVAVNVRMDNTISEQSDRVKFHESQPLESEIIEETVTQNTQNAGEPGVRSNAGADIAGNRSTGTSSTHTKSETNFLDLPVSERVRAVKRGQTAEQVNVTVNVPRSYFVSLYQQANGEDAMPTDADLAPMVQQQLDAIRQQVEPQVQNGEVQGMVTAHMILDASAMLAMTAAAGGEGGIGGMVDSVGGPQTLMIATLSLFSVGLMFYMVRKATKPSTMPTAEELAGVPPQLDGEEDLIGEVMEHEPSMPGMELDDEDVQSRKVAQQIGELIENYPYEAAALFKRWIRAEEG